MAAFEPVALVKLGIPARGLLRDKIGAQQRRIVAPGAADDLFHFSFVKIDAGPEHAEKLTCQLSRVESEGANVSCKNPPKKLLAPRNQRRKFDIVRKGRRNQWGSRTTKKDACGRNRLWASIAVFFVSLAILIAALTWEGG